MNVVTLPVRSMGGVVVVGAASTTFEAESLGSETIDDNKSMLDDVRSRMGESSRPMVGVIPSLGVASRDLGEGGARSRCRRLLLTKSLGSAILEESSFEAPSVLFLARELRSLLGAPILVEAWEPNFRLAAPRAGKGRVS